MQRECMKKKILILNGSPSGNKGNCAGWIRGLLILLKKKASVEVVHLAKTSYGMALRKKIQKADGIVFVTGTYWDSWGSPLQKLLEDMTDLEASSELMGKPAAVFVLMHSVGEQIRFIALARCLINHGFFNSTDEWNGLLARF